MRVSYSSKNGNLTERERELAEKKLGRLARFFRGAREAHVTHSVQRNWQIVEVQINLDGTILRAEDRSGDFAASLDGVVGKLEQQVTRLKSKLKQHKGHADAPTVAAVLAEDLEPAGDLPAGDEDEELPTVVRRKRFAIKPMTVDEAALQLDLLNHDFFAFRNAETDEANVLYRRRDGNFGLLELEG